MPRRVLRVGGLVVVSCAVLACAPSVADVTTGSEALSGSGVSNGGFESDWSGWTRSGDTGLTTVTHGGDTAAKVSSSTGRIERTVSGLAPNTRYVLSAWVLGEARIGAYGFGRSAASTALAAPSWARANVVFTTGSSNTSARIYAEWTGGGDARVDDFALVATSSDPFDDVDVTPSPGSRVTASTSGDHPPSGAVDGELDTRWSGYGDGAWLRLDLGELVTISRIEVAPYDGTDRRHRFDLQVSRDGSSWTTVWSGRSSGRTSTRETYDFTDVTARYVRYVGHGYSGDSPSLWNGVNELVVRGPFGLATGCTLPSQLLDLARWKVQLPFGDPTAEVHQPALAAYATKPYFRVNAACTGVQLRAPTSGETTSNSDYPRSELREMTSDGERLASWSTTSGTHTLFIDQAVTRLPDGKRHVIVGQIHDADNDVIVIRLEGSKLIARPNGTEGVVLDSSYSLGDRFTVKLVASGGTIRVYYNGRSTPSLTTSRSRSGCYFKAGVYPQSNCETEERYGAECGESNHGEVHIYDL